VRGDRERRIAIAIPSKRASAANRAGELVSSEVLVRSPAVEAPRIPSVTASFNCRSRRHAGQRTERVVSRPAVVGLGGTLRVEEEDHATDLIRGLTGSGSLLAARQAQVHILHEALAREPDDIHEHRQSVPCQRNCGRVFVDQRHWDAQERQRKTDASDKTTSVSNAKAIDRRAGEDFQSGTPAEDFQPTLRVRSPAGNEHLNALLKTQWASVRIMAPRGAHARILSDRGAEHDLRSDPTRSHRHPSASRPDRRADRRR